MSSRNGRYLAAFGGLIATALLLVLAPSSNGQQAPDDQRADSASQQQAANDAKGAPSPINAQVVKGEASNQRAKKTKDDPRDNWVIRALKFFDRHNGAFNALAAIAVAFFTWRLWRLSVKEIDALGQQSEDVERSIAEAARAATAMEKVAEAMGQSVGAMKERTAQQMRAYISVAIGDAAFQERAKDLAFVARPFMLNTGLTPAHNVRFRARADILPIPLPADFSFPLPSEFTGRSVLNPQQTFIITRAVDHYIDERDVPDVKANKGRALYMWGEIQYEDVFGDSHTTRFAYHAIWFSEEHRMGYWEERHNDAD